MSSTLPISGPLSLGDLLDRAFRLYRARFWPFVLVGALFLVPLGVITGIMTGQTMTGFSDAAQQLNRRPPSEANDVMFDALGMMGGLYGAMFLQVILLGLATSLAQMAMTVQTMAALHHEPMSVGQSIQRSFGRLLPFLGMAFVHWVVAVGAAVLGLIPFFCIIFAGSLVAGIAGMGADFGGSALGAGVIGMVAVIYCVGFVSIMIPYLYVVSRWLVSVPAVMAGAGPLQALGESWRLTRGNIWRTIFYGILLGILSLLIVSLPALVVQWGLGIVLGDRNMLLATAIAQAMSSIASVLWLPLNATAIVLLYYDLRVRQEGYDVALRIQQLETDTPPATPTLPESGSND